MSTLVADPGFKAHTPRFDLVLGEEPELRLVAELDAHQGPVYFADEHALYFTTLPRPGVDRSPSVQLKRLPLDRPEAISVVVADANGANGMASDSDGGLIVCEREAGGGPLASVGLTVPRGTTRRSSRIGADCV